jgi:predicted site-specific integrase-resolvase
VQDAATKTRTAPILSDYMEDQELATDLGRSTRTLARWRRLGEGPPIVKVGRQVLYRREAVREWLGRLERDGG